MSVRVHEGQPGGRATFYHTRVNPDGSTDEHFVEGRVRASPTHNITYCPYCDAVTWLPRVNGDEHAREVEDHVQAGRLLPLPAPAQADPFVLAREDGLPGIPPQVPQDTAGRRALSEALRRRP